MLNHQPIEEGLGTRASSVLKPAPGAWASALIESDFVALPPRLRQKNHSFSADKERASRLERNVLRAQS